MEVFAIVLFVIGVVIANHVKVKKEAQKKMQARQQQQERTRMTSHYEAAPIAPAQPVPGQVHLNEVLPERRPAAEKTDARMPFAPTEGVPFHPPGFHGGEKPRMSGSMEKKPLEKTDLGLERAKQNAHTAANALWKAPQAQEENLKRAEHMQNQPRYTAKQLRDAFIMQEILDEPVSRRKGIKRGYGS